MIEQLLKVENCILKDSVKDWKEAIQYTKRLLNQN